MLSLIIIIFIIIVFGIIYIRKRSKIFMSTKINTSEEDEKINDKKDQMKEVKNINIGPISPGIIDKYNPQTPDTFLVEKKFIFNNICCVDKNIINKENDTYIAKCGHLYHISCFNRLVEDLKKSKEKQDLKCVSCKEIIYSK